MNPATDWIDQARGLLDMLKQGATTAPSADDHGSDCRWCPLCQAAAVLRGERPEVTAAIADVLTATAAALRTIAEPPAAAPSSSSADASADDVEAPASGGPGDPPPVMQRIDIA